MIKIDLDDIQKNKITKEMYSFFSSKKISEKVKKLSDFLDIKHCTNTANLFSSVDVDYLLTFGKTELQENINKYNKAILSDSLISGIDEKKIIEYIFEGSSANKIQGFSNYYKIFCTSDEAYEILKIINVKVCPYCNRQYTFTARKYGLKVRPQFDHFFPKSLYPYLSISIYNLIPSCSLCNRGKSNNSPDNLIYPYEESFESKKISFSVDNIIPYLLGEEKNIEISLTSSDPSDKSVSKIIKEYYTNFKIKLLYEQHSDYVEDIILKKIIFNEDTIKSICSSYPGIFSRNKFEQLIFNKYDTECHINHPLSKFTSDIFDQI